MKRSLTTLIGIGLAVSLSACSSTATKTGDGAAVQSSHTVAVVPVTQNIDQIIKTLAGNSVFFDYNAFVVKPEYMAQLKQDYELLKQNPKLAVRVEGNADERGSAEYNLALGQKRAEAVKRALIIMGVPESQLEAISYGSEKPRATCHEEQCWAQNRRVDLAVKKSS